jgi:hypothetical protein
VWTNFSKIPQAVTSGLMYAQTDIAKLLGAFLQISVVNAAQKNYEGLT